MLCFSQDPLLFSGVDLTNYLADVASMRQIAQNNSLPFWMMLQCQGCTAVAPCGVHRIPDAGDLRYLAYTFLAHGGQGIIFPGYYGGSQDMIIDAQLDYFGTPDPTDHVYEFTYPSRAWTALRNLVPEFLNLTEYLIHVRSTGNIKYVGTVPANCSGFTGHGALLDAEVIENPADPALISWFDDWRGQEYFMLVNLSHGLNLSKADALRTIKLTFDSTVAHLEKLNRLTGEFELLVTEPDGLNHTIDVSLEGGTGELFRIDGARPWPSYSPSFDLQDFASFAGQWLWCDDPGNLNQCGTYLTTRRPEPEFNPAALGLWFDFDTLYPTDAFGILEVAGTWDFTTQAGRATAPAGTGNVLTVSPSYINGRQTTMPVDQDWLVYVRLRRNDPAYTDRVIELNGQSSYMIAYLIYSATADTVTIRGQTTHDVTLTSAAWHDLLFHYQSDLSSLDVWIDGTRVLDDLPSMGGSYDLEQLQLRGPTTYDHVMVAPRNPYLWGDFDENHYINLADFQILGATWQP